MPKRKSAPLDPEKAYSNQIEPLINHLLRRCKHYGFPVLVAASVPLTETYGNTMLLMQPDHKGCVPTEFKDAAELISQPPRDTVTEIPAFADAEAAPAEASCAANG